MFARVGIESVRSRRRRSLPAVIGPLVVLVCLGSGWILSGAADSLSAGKARELLQRLGGGDLKKNQIQIKKISSGIGGGAIVEAQIETAFRFTQEGREWKVAEVRLGDRQWESLELIDEAVRAEKARRTTAVLERISAGLTAYHRANGRYVVADEFVKMLDALAPQYLGPIVHFDLWGTPLNYRGAESGYRLTSAGPDRSIGTSDDVVFENGVIGPKSVAQSR